MRRHLRMFCLIATIVSSAACDEKLSTIAGPTPDLEPSFSSIQSLIFESSDSAGRRACVACHSTATPTGLPAGGLNLLRNAAYDQLVNVPSRLKPSAIRVVPGDPDASYIVHKVEGRAGIVGQRMPIAGPYLTDGQILILRRWIEQGARRD